MDFKNMSNTELSDWILENSPRLSQVMSDHAKSKLPEKTHEELVSLAEHISELKSVGRADDFFDDGYKLAGTIG